MYYQVLSIEFIEWHPNVFPSRFGRALSGHVWAAECEVQHTRVNMASGSIPKAATYHVRGTDTRHDCQTTALLCGSIGDGFLPIHPQLGEWKACSLPDPFGSLLAFVCCHEQPGGHMSACCSRYYCQATCVSVCRSNLVDMAQDTSMQFGQDPPLFSKPPNWPPPAQPPTPQHSDTFLAHNPIHRCVSQVRLSAAPPGGAQEMHSMPW